jgi:general transcription factor 3C polypeptide 5 (transcription factor C subunit 1)
MWKSGPFRDAYVVFGIDPRKEKKWAGYQTAIFSFRGDSKDGKKVKEDEGLGVGTGEGEVKSHLFTGREVNIRGASFCFQDVTDPMLRKILDDAVLRDKFHVPPPFPAPLALPFFYLSGTWMFERF